MSSKKDDFLINKIKEINANLECNNADMYELIGSVRDLFLSAYISKPIASSEVIKELFNVLLNVFIHSDTYQNQFDSIVTMNDVNLYARRQKITLCLCELEKWRREHDNTNSTEEILECVDDILIL